MEHKSGVIDWIIENRHDWDKMDISPVFHPKKQLGKNVRRIHCFQSANKITGASRDSWESFMQCYSCISGTCYGRLSSLYPLDGEYDFLSSVR